MREFLEKVGAFVPTYVRETLALAGGPKKFISKKLSDQTDALSNSLIHLAVSTVLMSLMLGVPLNDAQHSVAIFSKILIQLIIMSIISAWSVWLSWKIVGGLAPVTPYIIIYSYYSGVASLIAGISFAIFAGVVKTFDGRATIVVSGGRPYVVGISWSDPWLSPVYFSLLAVSGATLCLWGFIGWGAYRELNGANRVQSTVALTLTLIFGTMLMIIGYMLGRGME